MVHEKTLQPHAVGAPASGVRTGCFAPATLALLIQVAAMLIVLPISFMLNKTAILHINLWGMATLQALMATALCFKMGMAVWWRWIHAAFPLALLLVTQWQLPSEIFLIGFFVTLSLFWTTFRSQVPFFPSRPVVWQKVAALLPQHKTVRMIDIGSGLGDLSMHIAKSRIENHVKGESHIEGIEIAPLPWLISRIRGVLTQSPARFILGDYQRLDFGDYDLVFAYLSPAAMPALWLKAKQEMRPGSQLVSCEFIIPDNKPSLVIQGNQQASTLYIWRF